MGELISKRSTTERMIIAKTLLEMVLQDMHTAEPEIIRCKDCEYGEQDEEGWWYCSDLGCQMGDEDGSGFCADAERRKNDG